MLPRPSTTISFHRLSDSPAQVGVGDQRPVGLLRRSSPSGPRRSAGARRAASRSRTGGRGDAGHDLAVAVDIDGDDLLRAPVARTTAGPRASAATRRSRGRSSGPAAPAVRRASASTSDSSQYSVITRTGRYSTTRASDCDGPPQRPTDPRCHDEGRSARKRRAILEAATTRFLRNGYRGTSMDEIAARAAVSKQTVYKHFADKETPLRRDRGRARSTEASDPVHDEVLELAGQRRTSRPTCATWPAASSPR